jgi:hypothetical protein
MDEYGRISPWIFDLACNYGEIIYREANSGTYDQSYTNFLSAIVAI